jgi:hypothetical protein
MRLALLALLPAIALAQDDNGSIRGVVLDAVSHSPVKKAQVGLNLNSFANTGRPGPVPQRGFEGKSAMTGQNGEFSFSGLPAGSYTLWVNHPRYPGGGRRQQQQQRVEVGSGDEPAKVTFELTPAGSIAGRVVDEDGDPITGCFPQLRPANNPRMGIQMLGAEPSNGDGEYRIYGLPAGKYILAIQCHRPVFQPRPLSPGPDPPPSLAYMPQFYPLSADKKGAETIDLAAGVDKSGVDFKLAPTPVTSIHGVLKMQGAVQKIENMNISLFPEDEGRRSFFGNMGANFDNTKGTFEFQSVLPGAYILYAFTFRNGEDDTKPQYGARRVVQVMDQPMEVDLDLQPAFDLVGSIDFDGEHKPEGQQGYQVNLMPFEDFSGGNGPVQMQPDGSFTIKSVMPGLWKLQVFVGQGGFVKAVFAGGRELPDGVIDTTAGPAGPLRVLISTKTGSIHGSGPPGRTVAVVSVGDERFQQHYGAMIDNAGEFTVQGLPPGKYKLALADQSSPDIWAEEGGTIVTVPEGETASVELTESR